MNFPFRFQLYSLSFLVLLMTSSCQVEDDVPRNDDVPPNPNALPEISALPEAIIFPDANPYSEAKAELGRTLFWDPILSGTKDVACATCHHPSFGYADGRDLPLGVNGIGVGPNRRNGVLVKRNSPSILNTAFNGMDISGNYDPATAPMFWDNRERSLEAQALLPILSKEEMRGELIAEEAILDSIVQRLRQIDGYEALFVAAFGSQEVNIERVAQAIATFQREIIANNSPFDQYMQGNDNAMSNQEIRGMNTFIEVGCANCHSGAMFSDFDLHTLSVPDHPDVEDEGATGAFDFRTPTLRNLDFTAPYMHNGSFDDLRDVLQFYNDISGGGADSQNPNVADNQIDRDARQLQLNGGDINEIISFLNTLNDDDFDRTIPQTVPSGLSVGGNLE